MGFVHEKGYCSNRPLINNYAATGFSQEKCNGKTPYTVKFVYQFGLYYYEVEANEMVD